MRKGAAEYLPLAVMVMGLVSPVLADIYCYVDENGVKHYTNQPKPNYVRVLTSRRATPEDKTIYLDPYYYKIVMDACAYYKVEPALIMAMIKVESNFDRYAVSPKGAQGLMQLMPATADRLRVNDPFHPVENIWAGVYYVKYLMVKYNYNYDLVLAAYNAGENAVAKYNGIPPYKETRNYVKKVYYYWALYRETPPRFQAPTTAR